MPRSLSAEAPRTARGGSWARFSGVRGGGPGAGTRTAPGKRRGGIEPGSSGSGPAGLTARPRSAFPRGISGRFWSRPQEFLSFSAPRGARRCLPQQARINIKKIRAIDLCKKNNMSWKWVKGHSTNKYNNLADELATQAMRS